MSQIDTEQLFIDGETIDDTFFPAVCFITGYYPVVQEIKDYSCTARDKFGGEPHMKEGDEWPLCSDCNLPLKLWFQVTDPRPDAKTFGKTFQAFRCEEWEEHSPFIRFIDYAEPHVSVLLDEPMPIFPCFYVSHWMPRKEMKNTSVLCKVLGQKFIKQLPEFKETLLATACSYLFLDIKPDLMNPNKLESSFYRDHPGFRHLTLAYVEAIAKLDSEFINDKLVNSLMGHDGGTITLEYKTKYQEIVDTYRIELETKIIERSYSTSDLEAMSVDDLIVLLKKHVLSETIDEHVKFDSETVLDLYVEQFNSDSPSGVKFGGYIDHTQGIDFSEHILQFSYNEDYFPYMWGDCGIGHILPDGKGGFNPEIYWDCC